MCIYVRIYECGHPLSFLYLSAVVSDFHQINPAGALTVKLKKVVVASLKGNSRFTSILCNTNQSLVSFLLLYTDKH